MTDSTLPLWGVRLVVAVLQYAAPSVPIYNCIQWTVDETFGDFATLHKVVSMVVAEQ